MKVIGRGDKTREGMLRWLVGGWLGRALEKEIFVLKKSLGKVSNFGSKNRYEPWDMTCANWVECQMGAARPCFPEFINQT